MRREWIGFHQIDEANQGATMNQTTQRGLTLVEASIVLTVVALSVTTAIAGFGDLIQKRHTEGVAAELANDLQFVRTEAVARNQGVRIGFGSESGGARCYVIHTGAAGACSCLGGNGASCKADAPSRSRPCSSRLVAAPSCKPTPCRCCTTQRAAPSRPPPRCRCAVPTGGGSTTSSTCWAACAPVRRLAPGRATGPAELTCRPPPERPGHQH